MLSTRQQFLLTSLGYLAFAASPVSADFGWGGNGNGGPPGNWNNDGGWSGCAWFTGNSDCDDNSSNGNGNGNGDGGNSDPSRLSLSGSELERYNRIITIHAVLACLVWVL